MINRQSHRLKVVSDDVRRDSNTINDNAALPKKEVSEAFEDMLPVFVTSKVVITNVKVEKSKGTKNGKNG